MWCETLTSGIALRGDFETQSSSGRIREWHESLSMAALVDLKPQEPGVRLRFRFGCSAGLLGCRAGRWR
jgi:hypothetical protein